MKIIILKTLILICITLPAYANETPFVVVVDYWNQLGWTDPYSKNIF